MHSNAVAIDTGKCRELIDNMDTKIVPSESEEVMQSLIQINDDETIGRLLKQLSINILGATLCGWIIKLISHYCEFNKHVIGTILAISGITIFIVLTLLQPLNEQLTTIRLIAFYTLLLMVGRYIIVIYQF